MKRGRIVADRGYGRSVSFRLGLEEHGWSYVMAVEPKEIARSAGAVPYLPPYQGLGPPTLTRYREPRRPVRDLVDPGTRFETVTWRQGSKGSMTSRFAVLEVRSSGKEATRTAQEHAGGRSRWDGVLALRTLLVEQPRTAAEPTGYWMTNLPAAAPIADLVCFAKMRRRIEHDYRELEHGLAWTTSRGAPGAAGTITSPSSPPPRPSSPAALRPKSPHDSLSLYQVLDTVQDLLRCWTGICTTCGRPLATDRTRSRT